MNALRYRKIFYYCIGTHPNSYMDTTKIVKYLALLLLSAPLTAMAQVKAIDAQTAATLEHVEQLQLENQNGAALKTLEAAIRAHADKPDDLAYLYAHQSGIYVAMDSLLLGKRLLDSSMRYATDKAAKAVAYRAKAFLANYLSEPDEVVKDALTGLA